jgi:hypothetical protein
MNEPDDELDVLNETETDSASGISFGEGEFIRYCEANEFDHDEAGMDEDTRKDFIKIKKRFMKAVAEKRIVVEGDKLIYTVSDRSPKEMAGQKLTVSRPNGRTLLAMDGHKDTQQQTKLLNYMAALCRISRSDIHKISSLDKKDHQIIQDVAILFLTE